MLCIPVGHLYYDTMCCALLYCSVSAHALLQPAVVQRKQCSAVQCCAVLCCAVQQCRKSFMLLLTHLRSACGL